MGMFDTVYAALDCPFCGRKYRYTPLSYEQAECEIKKTKQDQIETRRKFLQGKKQPLQLQEIWARQDGFEDIDTWIDQLDAPDHIEAFRTRPSLGMAEIQTKEFENVMAKYYIGDEIPKYFGHYYIPASFHCEGCSTPEARVYVGVWLEIKERKLIAVRTCDPETGEPTNQMLAR
jgi:uncharacterized Zn-finger protein